MKVSNAVVNVLKEQGAKVIFGIPGGQTLYFTDALIGTDIQFIQTRHENGAGCAADGWGRLTGKPGLCLATTGPGATNLITAIGGAMRDSSPVIVYLFQNRLADAGRGDAQDSNHEALFGSLVKSYIPVRDASAAVWAMREAYRVAVTGKPGPVVVDFYRDVIEQGECEYVEAKLDQYCCKSVCVPPQSQIDDLLKKLSEYKKLCIWSGNGVKMSRTGNKVIELAEKLCAPVVTTFNGISSVPTEHPLVFGPRSRHGSEMTREILEGADCVLVLGSSLTAISTNRWTLKIKNMIQIDVVPSQIGRHYPVVCGLVGELGNTLDLISSSIKEASYRPEREAWVRELSARKNEWESMVFSGAINDASAVPAAPVAVMRELNNNFKEDQIICVDAGNPGAWSHLFKFAADMRYMKPVNYGNMGFSIPAGIACSIAEPEKEVISFLGDGSLGMTLAEIDTAARFANKLIIVVFNDQAYGNIKQEELYKFGDGRYIGVDLSAINYCEVAKALGMKGETINSAGEIAGAFENARKYGKPYMIEIKFDGNYSVWPEAFMWKK